MGMALAGGRRRQQSVPPRACGLLREAGKWTVTDRLTHVSSGDLRTHGEDGGWCEVRWEGRHKSQAAVPAVSWTTAMGIPCTKVISVGMEWSDPTVQQSG